MSNDPLIYSIIGAGAGVFLFINGFRWLRQKKLIENIPTSKIRSLAMGLVEIKGKVVKEKKILKSPFSNKDCVYWKYKIERWHQSKNGGHWVTVKHGDNKMKFHVKDDTAQVMVDPEGATLDIPPDFEKVSGVRKSMPAGVEKFCQSNNIKTKGLFFKRKMRFREWYLEPSDEVYIMGTAGDNPHVEDSTGQKNVDDIMIQKGKNEKFYYISDKPEGSLLKTFKWKVVGGLFGGGALIIGCLAYMIFRLGLF